MAQVICMFIYIEVNSHNITTYYTTYLLKKRLVSTTVNTLD